MNGQTGFFLTGGHTEIVNKNLDRLSQKNT